MIKYKKLRKLLIWTCKQKKVGSSQLPSATRMAELEEIEPVPSILLPCTSCNRTFRPEALAKHAQVCEKSLLKKRKKFDSSKQRLQGTDLAAFPPAVTPVKPSPTTRKKETPGPSHPAKLKERQQAELTKSLMASRKRNEASTASAALATMVKPSDHDQCPHCQRHFGPKAFERHVEWCKEQQSKIKNSHINLEAKERLEVRTKYRAPLTSKVLTRDKYHPRSRDPSPSSRENMPNSLNRSSSQRLSSRSKTVVVNNYKRQEVKPTTSSARYRSHEDVGQASRKSPTPPKILSGPIHGRKKNCQVPRTPSDSESSLEVCATTPIEELSRSLIVKSCLEPVEDFHIDIDLVESDDYDAVECIEESEFEVFGSWHSETPHRRKESTFDDIYFVMSSWASHLFSSSSARDNTRDDIPQEFFQVPPGYAKIKRIVEIRDASTLVSFENCICYPFGPECYQYGTEPDWENLNCSSIAIQCCSLKEECFLGNAHIPCEVDSKIVVSSILIESEDSTSSSNSSRFNCSIRSTRSSCLSLIDFEEPFLVNPDAHTCNKGTSPVAKTVMSKSTQTTSKYLPCTSSFSPPVHRSGPILVTWADLAQKSNRTDLRTVEVVGEEDDSLNSERIAVSEDDSLDSPRDSLTALPSVTRDEGFESRKSDVALEKMKASFCERQLLNAGSWSRDTGKVKLEPVRLCNSSRVPARECSKTPRCRNTIVLPPLRNEAAEGDDDTYDPFASAEQQLLELLGVQPPQPPTLDNSGKSPQSQHDSPISAFALYTPVKSPGDSSPDLTKIENKENSNNINNNNNNNESDGTVSPHQQLDNRKQFSLSSLSLCSIVSLDSVDYNRNLGPGKYYKNKDDGLQRSFSAVDGKSNKNRVKVNMHQMLYGSVSPQSGSPKNDDADNLQACEAELLASMMEFQKMLDSSPPPLTPSKPTSPDIHSPQSPESRKKDSESSEESVDTAKPQQASLSIDSAYGSLTRGAGDAIEMPKNEIAKFCHECGSKYPVPSANFCCNCGVRRFVI